MFFVFYNSMIQGRVSVSELCQHGSQLLALPNVHFCKTPVLL